MQVCRDEIVVLWLPFVTKEYSQFKKTICSKKKRIFSLPKNIWTRKAQAEYRDCIQLHECPLLIVKEEFFFFPKQTIPNGFEMS